ncbi:MAG: NAD(P)/FAD-dependent oxidoreductase [Bryobacterales bacterium]|nr:NAD(P)/FAD-dependent oxidoreductase [Bryobacterales bacterium]
MFGRKKPEVLVVGAGPVGQFAALALAKRGVQVEIVDTGIWACSHSYALALHPDALALFDHFGLRDAALEKAYPVRTVGVYDETRCRAQIVLSPDGDPPECLAVLRQDAIEVLLEKALTDAGVKIQWRHEVADMASNVDHVLAKVNHLKRDSRGYVVAHSEWVVAGTERIDVPFVLGADGYESETRRSLGIDFEEVGEPEYYAVFEFQTDADLENEMRVCFAANTANVLWPLPGGACRWSFQLPEYASRESHRDKDRLLLSGGLERSNMVDDAHLRQFLEERAPWFKGSIDHVAWRMVVRFERRLAKSFGQHRMWLAGDAAHTTGPVGVQSMNVGMFEAWELAHMMKRVLHEGAPLSEVADCSSRWHQEWTRLHGVGGGLKAGPEVDPWLAAHAPALLSCIPAHGKKLNELAAQIGLSF